MNETLKKRLPFIAAVAAVIVAVVVIIIIASTNSGYTKGGEDTDYPFKWKSLKDGGIKIVLDGSKSDGSLIWASRTDKYSGLTITPKSKEGKKKATYIMSAYARGQMQASFARYDKENDRNLVSYITLSLNSERVGEGKYRLTITGSDARQYQGLVSKDTDSDYGYEYWTTPDGRLFIAGTSKLSDKEIEQGDDEIFSVSNRGYLKRTAEEMKAKEASRKSDKEQTSEEAALKMRKQADEEAMKEAEARKKAAEKKAAKEESSKKKSSKKNKNEDTKEIQAMTDDQMAFLDLLDRSPEMAEKYSKLLKEGGELPKTEESEAEETETTRFETDYDSAYYRLNARAKGSCILWVGNASDGKALKIEVEAGSNLVPVVKSISLEKHEFKKTASEDKDSEGGDAN